MSNVIIFRAFLAYVPSGDPTLQAIGNQFVNYKRSQSICDMIEYRFQIEVYFQQDLKRLFSREVDPMEKVEAKIYQNQQRNAFLKQHPDVILIKCADGIIFAACTPTEMLKEIERTKYSLARLRSGDYGR